MTNSIDHVAADSLSKEVGYGGIWTGMKYEMGTQIFVV